MQLAALCCYEACKHGGGAETKCHMSHQLFAQRLYSTLHLCLASSVNYNIHKNFGGTLNLNAPAIVKNCSANVSAFILPQQPLKLHVPF